MEEEIVKEFESTENDELFKVIRSFQLPVRKGPPVPVQAGNIVRLKHSTARELFPGKVLPLGLTDPGTYEAIENFRMVDDEKMWVEINSGDKLELTLEEALPLMKQFRIKPTKGKEESKNEISRT